MDRKIILLMCLLALAMPGVAERYTEDVGDYAVSFNLSEQYLSEVESDEGQDTLYITTTSHRTSVMIMNSASPASFDYDGFIDTYIGKTYTLQHDKTVYRGEPALFSVTRPSDAYMSSVIMPLSVGDGVAVAVTSDMGIFDFVYFVESLEIT